MEPKVLKIDKKKIIFCKIEERNVDKYFLNIFLIALTKKNKLI